MAVHNVILEVDFLDSAERTATRRYLLREQYDDVTPNMDDVLAQAQDVITNLNILSWDAIPTYRVCVEIVVSPAPTANVAANNQVIAFTRVNIDDDTKPKGFIEVPAWDDAVFDQNSDNLLSLAYNTAALLLIADLRDLEVGADLTGIEYNQSRTRKSGVKLG